MGIVEVGRDAVELVVVVDIAGKPSQNILPEKVLGEIVPVGVVAAVPEGSVDYHAENVVVVDVPVVARAEHLVEVAHQQVG